MLGWIPEMSQLNSGIPEMCYLIWAGRFREFSIVVTHFRNSWFELAHFGISWIVVAHFRNSLFEAGPFKKLFSKLRFFGMFFTSMNQFLASNSHLFRWHVYSAKKIGQKCTFLHEIRAQTFYYPIYGVTTACCVPWQR